MPEIYWKESGEETWHKINSTSPITYTQQNTPPQFTGGQCRSVWYEILVDANHVDPYGYTGRSTFSADWRKGNPRTEYSLIRGPITGYYVLPWPEGGYGSGFGRDIIATFNTTGWGMVEGAIVFNSSNYRLWNVGNFRVVRKDGLIDNCGNPKGGGCTTKFYSNGSLIKEVTKPECVQVLETPNECDCCKLMIPKASSILSRLSK